MIADWSRLPVSIAVGVALCELDARWIPLYVDDSPAVADLGVRTDAPLSVQIIFIFIQFSGQNIPNNRLAPLPGIGNPVWEILDPPLSDWSASPRY